jgi:capsid protein
MIDAVRVPADAVVHPFRATRAGQRRGVPWLAPVLDAIWHHTELRRAERVRFRASACTFATVSGANDDGDDGINPVEPMDGEEAGPTGFLEDADGNPVNQMVPGLIANVTHGKELKLHVPQAAIGYADAIRVEERDIARGVGLMYEALSGDLSMVNWASFRVGDVRFRALVDTVRAHVLQPLFLDPIAAAWLDFGLASGRITIPPGASVRVEWRWLPHEEMDREASARADVAEMRAGGVSFEQFCERRGTTLEEQIASHKRSLDALDAAGIKLDGIPAQTTNGGMAQSAPPAPA